MYLEKKGVFSDMNEAIEASKKAQKIVAKMSMDQREAIIPRSERRSKKMQKSLHVWVLMRPEWEM